MPTQFGLDGNMSTIQKPYENPALVQAIKEIKPDVYRTPGSAADYYLWRKTPPSLEAVKIMWDAVQCTLIFVLNMISKGKQHSISMLEHAAAIGLPVNKSKIEFGNELNIFGSIGREKYPTVTDYAKTCFDWWSDIKKLFPDSTPLLVGENKGYKDTVHWNKSCLDVVQDAGLVWHFHSPFYYVTNGEPDINILRAGVDQAKEDAFADVPIDRLYMTEFSTEQGGHDDPAQPRMNPQLSLHGEYLTVQTLLQKFQEINLPLACYHNAVGADGKGAIFTSRFGTWLEPSGEAIRDFISSR